jgi:transposase
VTLAPVPVGLENTSSFSVNIVALAIYLRFTHAISYRRLTQVFLHLFALQISEVRWMRCCSVPSRVSAAK